MHESMSPLRAPRPGDTSIVVRCATRHPGAVVARHGIGGRRQGEINLKMCMAAPRRTRTPRFT
jgi:hypothetical protein